VLGRDEVDRALDRLDRNGADISANLVALENHAGIAFLNGTQLTGDSAVQWKQGQAKIALLWAQFALYQKVVERAHAVRGQGRLGADELAELDELIIGRSATLEPQEIPIQQRDLLGPSSIAESMTLDELAAKMTETYREVTALVAGADEVWTKYLPLLDQLDERLRAAQSQTSALGLAESGHPVTAQIGAIADELDATRTLALSDPLTLVGPDTARLDRVIAQLDEVSAELDTLAELRDGFAQRVAGLRASIDTLNAEEQQATQACESTRERILVHPLPSITPAAADLAGRADRLNQNSRHWTEAADELQELERHVAAARSAAATALDTATALLGRRTELRARLDAYRVKAAQLRLSENAEISASYEQAYDALWAKPCDLNAATRSLVIYQKAISDRGRTP